MVTRMYVEAILVRQHKDSGMYQELVALRGWDVADDHVAHCAAQSHKKKWFKGKKFNYVWVYPHKGVLSARGYQQHQSLTALREAMSREEEARQMSILLAQYG